MEFAFAPNVSFYGCTSCVHFPLIKPAFLVESFLKQVGSAGLPNAPLGPDSTTGLTQRLIQTTLKQTIEPQFPLPSAEAIKQNPNIPVFSAAGGGTLWNFDEKRNASIPVYKCEYCRALYMLPLDVKEAARKVDMVVGVDGLTDEGVRDTCVQAMRNAYRGLNIGKKGEAEIYCFKTFVVMVCRPAENGEGKLSCNWL